MKKKIIGRNNRITNDNVCCSTLFAFAKMTEKLLEKINKAETEQKMSWLCELRCGWHRALDSWGLRSRLIRWCRHAVTGRCILKLISVGGGAEVCSGMERFNNLKPNYACPGIALYVYIESTESAYESSQFSWVNKKKIFTGNTNLKHFFWNFFKCCVVALLWCLEYFMHLGD